MIYGRTLKYVFGQGLESRLQSLLDETHNVDVPLLLILEFHLP